MVAYDSTANQWKIGVNGASNYMCQASAALTSGQLLQGGGNGAVSASGYTVQAAGGTGTAVYDASDATSLARSDHTHRTLYTMQWYFPGVVTTGTQTVRGLAPRSVTNCVIVDSQITADTTSTASSTYQIHRCTGSSQTSCSTTANIYTSAITLNANAETATGGTPNTTTITAGDFFRVALTPGTGLANVTVAMTYMTLI